tara:strand:- start:545 stop:1303 length:759 start_codon:yes stop_codon:yes gene_type:complete
MSKTLLLNDSTHYHHGCAKVIETFTFDHSIATNGSINVNFSDYSTVILNGEGTMHHNRNTALKFLQALKDAYLAKCDVQLVNTVWQDMTNDYDDVLAKCSLIQVRDTISQQELKNRHGIDSDIVPDRSIIPYVPFQDYPPVNVYQGNRFDSKVESFKLGCPKINIFKEDWNSIVNRLRHAKLLVTGRHHEAYAAIKAECEFIVLPGNTHKNEGIYLNAGVSPINSIDDIEDVLCGEYTREFNRIFEYYGKSI